MGETKIDRRRRYTLSVIQEAFFAKPTSASSAKNASRMTESV